MAHLVLLLDPFDTVLFYVVKAIGGLVILVAMIVFAIFSMKHFWRLLKLDRENPPPGQGGTP